MQTIATHFFSNLFLRLTDPDHRATNPCPYFKTYGIESLTDPREAAGIFRSSAGSPERPIIFIGNGLGTDTFMAPAQGKVDGVFHHAMALDNLLTQGTAYRHWPYELEFGRARLAVNFLIEWALILLTLMLDGLLPKHAPATEGEVATDGKRRFGLMSRLAIVVVTGVACCTLVSWIEISFLHWTPVNVLAITCISLTMFGIFEHEHIYQKLLNVKLGDVINIGVFVVCLSMFVACNFALPSAGVHARFSSAILLLVYLAVNLINKIYAGRHLRKPSVVDET